ncbi:MAG: hypothetical protein HDT51_01030 [Alistipes sp.]|nr:hypothetical protein [Alistipes sp.]
MKKLFSLLILSFVIVLSASAQDISSALRQAEARFFSGNETGAIELVTKVLQKYPDNQEAKALLEKFNKTISDRQIDADWQTAQTTNAFEAYEQFRTKHPGSKYDDTASDNMAKRLADKFTPNSSYSERTRAESYAQKGMTKDYIANKWKSVMAKKTSSSTSSSSSYRSSNTSNSSSSYSSNRSYGSSSSSNYEYRSSSYAKKDPFVTFGIEGSIEGLKSFSTGWGLSIRIGRFNSLFNSTIGIKYQYTGYKKWVSYSYDDYNNYWKYEYVYSSADYKRKVNQFVFPVILNWNAVRKDNYTFYLGVGYEFGVLLSDKQTFDYDFGDPFNESDFYQYGDEKLIQLSVPSRAVVVQMGFAGRHWDWKAYYKSNTNSSTLYNGEAGAVGTAFTYYF